MEIPCINDRGEIVGTRMTVYNLVVDFLDPTKTETLICSLYGLTAEQVAAARSYIFSNPDTVLARHLEIEQRNAAGNPPEVNERASKAKATFAAFRKWLAEQEEALARDLAAESDAEYARNGKKPFPSFREWLAQQESQAKGS